MKINSKNFLSLFLSVLTLVYVIPFGTVTATALTSGDFEYSVISEEKKTCKITKYNGNATELTIPSQFDGYTVISIDEASFGENTSLTSVTIGNGVIDIGQMAFIYCTSLTSVLIPNTVTNIGDAAFGMCESLQSIIIPDSVINIGGEAFSGCTSLTSITIPDSVISIGDYAFSGCISLASIKMGNNVVSIGNYAFEGDTAFTDIVIPDSVTSVGEAAFENCTSLTSIDVEPGNKNFCSENGVLFNKDKKEIICYPAGKTEALYKIPNIVTSISEYAFKNCTSLTNIIVPNSVISIEWNAFYDCNNLTIRCYIGSYAEAYANVKGIAFKALGDFDSDGTINSEDYAILRECVMCRRALTEEQRIAADFDGDGTVDAFDVIALDLYINS